MITRFSLFEYCDNVKLSNGEKIDYLSPTALSFLYYEDELYVGYGISHGELAKEIYGDDDDVWNYIENQGRLYLKHKIISFWDTPDKSTFMNIINDLERKLDIKIWNNDFKLEIIRCNSTTKEVYDRYVDFEEHDSNIKFIPIELYKKVYTPSKKPLAYRQAVSGE